MSRICSILGRSGRMLASVVLLSLLLPVSVHAGALLVVHGAKDIGPLAVHDGRVYFAIVPRSPSQPGRDMFPVFTNILAAGRQATGSLVLGCWDGARLPCLLTLPNDVTQGGDAAYGAVAMAAGSEGVWVTGSRSVPDRQGGRFWLAGIHGDKIAVMEIDDGVQGMSLAVSETDRYVARNGLADLSAFRHPVQPTIERRGAWTLPIHVSPVKGTRHAPSFTWIPAHGLAANPDGVWGVAHFSGMVRIGEANRRAARLAELPIVGDLPPEILRQMRAMLDQMDRPDVGSHLLLHLTRRGGLAWLATIEPGALLVGDSAGGGLAPSVITVAAIAVDARGNAYVAGSYSGSVRIGSLIVSAPEDDPDRCFVASWDVRGEPRWLRDIACGRPLNILHAGVRLVLLTEHSAMILDPADGHTLRTLPLPDVEAPRGSVVLHWKDGALMPGGELVLGGIFRGTGRILGQTIEAPAGVGLLARVSLGDVR